jgi:PhnB protein
MNKTGRVSFAPQLYIPRGVKDISFYQRAFGAIEQRVFSNDDGSIHVAEFSIGDVLFHLHEVTDSNNFISPIESGNTTVLIGLFVYDVDTIMKNAMNAGATLISPAKDYDYGYRQGQMKDPFGHFWMIEMKI